MFSVSQASANLINNGSFESGSSGWGVSGNVWFDSVLVSDGASSVDFNQYNTGGNAVLTQYFSTLVGASYQLEFDFTAHGGGSGPQLLNVQLGTAGSLLNATIADIDPPPYVWETYTFDFIASSTSTLLRFQDITTNSIGSDGHLDRVSVVATPEPATLGLLAIGLLATVVSRRCAV